MAAKAHIRYMYPVKSSQIREVGYDPVKFYLVVQFKNFATYGYEGVDSETYCRLMNAESIGVYFTDFIKEQHEFELIKAAPKKVTKDIGKAKTKKAKSRATKATKARKV